MKNFFGVGSILKLLILYTWFSPFTTEVHRYISYAIKINFGYKKWEDNIANFELQLVVYGYVNGHFIAGEFIQYDFSELLDFEVVDSSRFTSVRLFGSEIEQIHVVSSLFSRFFIVLL